MRGLCGTAAPGARRTRCPLHLWGLQLWCLQQLLPAPLHLAHSTPSFRACAFSTQVWAATEFAEKELGWRAKLTVKEMCRDQWAWVSSGGGGWPCGWVGMRRLVGEWAGGFGSPAAAGWLMHLEVWPVCLLPQHWPEACGPPFG